MARLVITVVCVAVFGVGIFAIWAWWAGDDDPPKLDALDWKLAEKAVAEVVVALDTKGLPKGVDTLTEPALTGAKGPEVAKLLLPALRERKWQLTDVGTFKQDHPSLSRWVETVLGNTAGKWFDARWKEAGVHGFVRGQAEYAERDGARVLELAVRVEDSASGTTLLEARAAPAIARSLFDLEYYRLCIDGWGTGWRILTWLLVLLFLPLACYPLAVRGLRSQSNAVNLSLWLGFTAVDLGVAVAFTGFRAPGFFGTVGLLLGLALALFYNYGILTEIEDLSK